MSFIGRYYHALEQKGRLAIPKAFRAQLQTGAIITRGLDGCLYLFPQTTWDSIISQAATHPFTQKASREWVRILTHNAHQVDFDSQGRILIPEHLRELAHLSKDCVLAGSIDKVEIWHRDTYHQYMEKLDAQAETIAESIQTNQEDSV